MEALADSGLVRSIGVSNLSVKKLEELLGSCRIPPAVNQVCPIMPRTSPFKMILSI